jgi:pimeloyl-ACP methyl ester carboxylesterase
MRALYRRWIHTWERRLHDTQRSGRPARVCRPFEWGGEWVGGRPGEPPPILDPAQGEMHFAYQRPRDYALRDGVLTFSSALPSPHPENNTVYARWFPAKQARRRAVIVLPQWNGDEQAHLGLCRLLNAFGLAALRLSMPYHDWRMPAGLTRADYAVSANIGRTVHANRQAVIDTRCLIDWLMDHGYESVGILGTSLGSCIAYIAAAHDQRLRAQACNHVSTYFADVVWRGLSTAHVAQSLREGITLDELRRHWAVISPASYVDRFVGRHVPTLLVWARYDLSFPPDLSQELVRIHAHRRLPYREMVLPCGHYTTGVTPFKWMDGVGMARFLAKSL